MKILRSGIFETNSSSTHSLTICTEEEFEKFKNNELMFDKYNDELIEKPEDYDEVMNNSDKDSDEKRCEYEDYIDYNDYEHIDFESFEQHFETPSGDKMVAFGYYGYDG